MKVCQTQLIKSGKVRVGCLSQFQYTFQLLRFYILRSIALMQIYRVKTSNIIGSFRIDKLNFNLNSKKFMGMVSNIPTTISRELKSVNLQSLKKQYLPLNCIKVHWISRLIELDWPEFNWKGINNRKLSINKIKILLHYINLNIYHY